jgi:hypothetical protein
MRHRFSVLLGLIAATSLSACGGSDSGAGAAGGGTGGGTSDAGGATGTGGASTYVAPKGDPITAPDLTWTWVDIPGAKCRDGSGAGFAVSKNAASDKVMIFLEGGGACYNQFTCGANPANFAQSNLAQVTTGGLLTRSNAANPVKDWNYVYVPFCTGDVFGGSAENVTVAGVPGVQQFVGYRNIDLFLDRIVPTFPHPSQVLHTGESAGGFGAGLTVELVASKFPPGTKINLLDDSGPAMSTKYATPCLLKGWREIWGFDNSFLKACGADCPDKDGYSIDWTIHLAKKYPNSATGIISSNNDPVITLFYGYGANNCGVDPTKVAPSMSGADFDAGLLDFRAQITAKSKQVGTYYIPEAHHTWIKDDTRLYSKTVDGVKLIDWVTDIINGKPAAQVGQ